MNLSEAFDAALPELPKARLSRRHPPRLDPELIVREDVLDGEPSIGVYQRSKANFFRLSPAQWELAQLYDGVRNYEEIAEIYTERAHIQLDADDARAFADNMESNDFWYKTSQEKNIALNEKLQAQRKRLAQRRSRISLAHISFSAWDPDRYLTMLDNKLGSFIYSPWCVLAVVLLFLFEIAVFTVKWSVIGPDIPLYYNFAHKGFGDLAEFWVLFLIIGFIHETAHGLTCKHYGGEVHSMGLMFLYLTPAFYVDVTESWVSANRPQRLATIIAGIWIEMVLCGIAIVIWTSTLPGDWMHDFCYKIILLTGLAVVVINMNPLIKLDGYYFLTESIGIPDLKERATGFLIGWVQRYIFGMPVDVPIVARRRLPLFISYALLSGAYSYVLLFAVIQLSYNVGYRWLGEFALLPAGAMCYAIFRSRIRSLSVFAKDFVRARRDAGQRWRPWHFAAGAALLVLLFVPLWRDRESAYYVIEPGRSVTLHAVANGRVEKVLVVEGARVQEGQELVILNSDDAASLQASSIAQTANAHFQQFDAEVRRQGVAGAAAEIAGADRAAELSSEVDRELILRAPWSGVVTTSGLGSLQGRLIGSGVAILSIADDHDLKTRLYIPAVALARIAIPADVSLMPPGRFRAVHAHIEAIDGEAVNLPPGLVAEQQYKGIEMPTYYSARMGLSDSEGRLVMGMSGEAIVFGRRRSIAQRVGASFWSMLRAHLW